MTVKKSGFSLQCKYARERRKRVSPGEKPQEEKKNPEGRKIKKKEKRKWNPIQAGDREEKILIKAKLSSATQLEERIPNLRGAEKLTKNVLEKIVLKFTSRRKVCFVKISVSR